MSLSSITLSNGTNRGKIKGDFLGIDVAGNISKSYTGNGSLLLTVSGTGTPDPLNVVLDTGNDANNKDILNLKNLNLNENLKFKNDASITSNNDTTSYDILKEETGHLVKFCNDGFSFKNDGIAGQGFQVNTDVLSQRTGSIQSNFALSTFFSARTQGFAQETYFCEYVQETVPPPPPVIHIPDILPSPSYLSFSNDIVKLLAGSTGNMTLLTEGGNILIDADVGNIILNSNDLTTNQANTINFNATNNINIENNATITLQSNNAVTGLIDIISKDVNINATLTSVAGDLTVSNSIVGIVTGNKNFTVNAGTATAQITASNIGLSGTTQIIGATTHIGSIGQTAGTINFTTTNNNFTVNAGSATAQITASNIGLSGTTQIIGATTHIGSIGQTAGTINFTTTNNTITLNSGTAFQYYTSGQFNFNGTFAQTGGQCSFTTNNNPFYVFAGSGQFIMDGSEHLWRIAGVNKMYVGPAGWSYNVWGFDSNTYATNYYIYTEGNQRISFSNAGYTSNFDGLPVLNYGLTFDWRCAGSTKLYLSTTSVDIHGPLNCNALGSSTGTSIVIDGGNNIRVLTSSRKFKEDINDLVIDSSAIYKLTPKSYKYIDGDGCCCFGYIAEDVQDAGLDLLVIKDKDDLPFSLNYQQMCVVLVEEMKKLNDRLKVLEG